MKLSRLFFIFSIGYCAATFAQDKQVLFSLAGSNTIGANLAPACAKAFLAKQGLHNIGIYQGEKANEKIIYGTRDRSLYSELLQIKIAAHGSSTGFKALGAGSADIAMSSRPIRDGEVQVLKQLGDMRAAAVEQTIAIDGLAIIVHRDNPINHLSIEQIAAIFSGEINNWQSLGGPNLAIHFYARDDNSGTWEIFQKLVLQDKALKATAKRFESNDLLSDTVSQDKHAIGFVSLASVRASKVLAVSAGDSEAKMPSVFSVATEDYPLSRRLYLYLPEQNVPAFARQFVSFCQSNAGQIEVEEAGFVAQNIFAYEAKITADMPLNYQLLAQKAQRLSINFRFAAASPKIDNKARQDVQRLVEFMQKEENKAAKLILVGFSDVDTGATQDELLSRYRALAVRWELLRANINVHDSFGLGSLMPVADNKQSINKLKNGRVEVWLSR